MSSSPKLRIAEMVTGHFTIPPPEGVVYAPMDIAAAIGTELSRRGHEVTFYAPEGSTVEGCRTITAGLTPLRKDAGAPSHPIFSDPAVRSAENTKIFNLWDQYLIAQMFIDAARHRYDILHIHPPDRAMPLAITHPDIPVVYTLHDPIYPWRRDIFRMFQSPNQYFVSISDAQRRPAPDLNYAATIYNGIPLDAFPFSERSEDFFLFVGRLHPEKGVREAVEAARLAGVRLKIIGPPVTGEYWEKHVKPYLGEQIEYVGFVPRKDLFRFYGRAKATLVPIQWEEPFGLVLVESMACGTPVIAFRRGSVPEVVKHGETGLIVETVEEIAAAIKTIDAIDRAACRRHVEEHFSIEKMAEGYERVFLQILEQKIEERT